MAMPTGDPDGISASGSDAACGGVASFCFYTHQPSAGDQPDGGAVHTELLGRSDDHQLYHLEKPGENGRAMIAANWQGVANAGVDLHYDLSKYDLGLSGRTDELRLNLKPTDR